MKAVRVLVHDYAGHVGQVAVSRELARRGFHVLHLYAAGIETPRGALGKRHDDDLDNFEVAPVYFTTAFQKNNYVRRQLQEIRYGSPLVRAVKDFCPDIVLSANTPLLPQAQLQWACRRLGVPFLFWMTDIYCMAVESGLRNKMGLAGRAIVRFYAWLERFLLRRADGVIVITERFKDVVSDWKVAGDSVYLIPVCAPIDEIAVGEKDNAWARVHGVATTRNIVYSGTLGTKHNPGLIAALARHFRDQPDVRIIAISQGLGADYLRTEKQACGLDNLILLPYQPYECLPDVLASADILLAVLEPHAASYSMPSKVLSQLCAGRAQIVAVPECNAVAQLVARAGAGLVVSPDDERAFVGAAANLLDDTTARTHMGANGRSYVERELGVERLSDAYVRLIVESLQPLGLDAVRQYEADQEQQSDESHFSARKTLESK